MSKLKKEPKTYNMPLIKRFEVTIEKDFGAFKSGDVTFVTLPIATKFINQGICSETSAIKAALKEVDAEELLLPKKEKRTYNTNKAE